MNLKLAATVQDAASKNVVSERAALVSPGILLEMQILRTYPRSTESESWEVGPGAHVFNKPSCHSYSC